MPYATLEEVWGNNYKNSNSNSNRKKKKKPKKINNTVNDKELEQYYNNLEMNEQLEEFQNFQEPITNNISEESNNDYIDIDYNQENKGLEQSFSGLEYNTDNYQSLDDQEYEKQNDIKHNNNGIFYNRK